MRAVATTITLNEMRERAAALIFGDDWIGSLTDEEHELLRTYPLIARDVHRTDGTTIKIDHADPVPARLASKIDRARGRAMRLYGQYSTVDSWLQAYGVFAYAGKIIDRKWFGTLIRAQSRKQKKTVALERRRGPKPKIFARVVADMESRIAAGDLTLATLADLQDKELESQFSASRDRVRAARAHVLNGHG